MNNDIDPDIRPGTEDRVTAAMTSLAATHTPDPRSINRTSRSTSSRRALLAVAASAVLVLGVGALLLASNRNTERATDQLPQPQATTTETEPDQSGTILPAVPPVTYSQTPLGNDVVPVVVPPPTEPLSGFNVRSDTSRWTRGIKNGTTFAAVEGDRVVGTILVFDTAAPWDTIAEGQNVTQINDHDVIRVEGSGERGFFIRVGDETRTALDSSPPSRALSIDTDVAALVAQVGDNPLDRFDDNDQFVRVPIDNEFGRIVNYGSQSAVGLVQVRLESEADEDSIDLVTQVYRKLIDDSDAAQISAVVQVSPVDLVVVIAANDEELASAVRDLQLVSIDESGVDFASYGGFTGDNLWARGEPSWGRWQVLAGGDGDCRFFQVNVWNIDGSGRGYTDCGERNPARTDGSQIYCVELDVEIVGTVVGATTEPVVAVDVDGLVAEQEDTTGSEFGKHTTFRIVQTEPGANIRAATVLVDGVEITCS